MAEAKRHIECNNKKFFIGDDLKIIFKNGSYWVGTLKQIYNDFFFADSEAIYYSEVADIEIWKE